MAIATGTAAVIAAGISAASAGGSAIAQGVKNKKSYKYTKKLAEQQYARDMEQWNRANTYNDPTQQMARLKAAGLNPNLVYGSGAGQSVATASPKYPQQRHDPESVQIPDMGTKMLNQYHDSKMNQAQVDNVKANTKATNIKAINDAITADYLKYKGKNEGIKFKYADQLGLYSLESKEQAIRQQKQQVTNLEMDGVAKNYQNELNKLGIHKNDNVMLRMIIQQSRASGSPIGTIIRDISNWLNNNKKPIKF